MQFITGEPALFLEKEKTLVVTDLHVGIEYELYRSGIKVPSQTEKMLNRLEKLINETSAKKLIILGDLKHQVPGSTFQEEREIPFFLNRLKQLNQGIKIEIVPGNHDPGLENYLPNGIKLHKNTGFRQGDTYFAHGHTWPRKDVLKAKTIISGHSHPQFEFKNNLGYRWMEPIWLCADIDKDKLKEKYKIEPKHNQEIILMPPFNSFSGGYPINRSRVGSNREFLGPVAKLITGKKKVYLLDGTFLGEV
ncbi:MAG: metallophosphoesterase [Nanoarchaeota archaeon]|nr:metallophosphoesterase [Nanoarchaeota archaeon]